MPKEGSQFICLSVILIDSGREESDEENSNEEN